MFNSFRRIISNELNRKKIKPTILKQTKQDNNIVYGAQAMMVQSHPVVRRGTTDYDIFSNNPKKSARKLEGNLDKQFGTDQFYMKEAMHKGTYKVMDKGQNLKSKRDDFGIADYSKPERKPKTIKVGGVKYVHISETKKDKLKSLKDPEYAFRHQKDRNDLRIIKSNERLRTIRRRL